MLKWLVTILGLVWASGSTSQAADFCNCCGDATVPACTTACDRVLIEVHKCIAILDFNADAKSEASGNALYDIPLQTLRVTGTDRSSLETLRRVLERLRRAVEADRRQAMIDRRNGTIDAAASTKAAHHYHDAMVNYYLGMQAYHQAKSGQR